MHGLYRIHRQVSTSPLQVDSTSGRVENLSCRSASVDMPEYSDPRPIWLRSLSPSSTTEDLLRFVRFIPQRRIETTRSIACPSCDVVSVRRPPAPRSRRAPSAFDKLRSSHRSLNEFASVACGLGSRSRAQATMLPHWMLGGVRFRNAASFAEEGQAGGAYFHARHGRTRPLIAERPACHPTFKRFYKGHAHRTSSDGLRRRHHDRCRGQCQREQQEAGHVVDFLAVNDQFKPKIVYAASTLAKGGKSRSCGDRHRRH
jgi:hypothetical protein